MLRKVGLAALLVMMLVTTGGVASASTGVDVASYQHPNGAPINWNQVRAAGHSFAYVKATESTTYTNPFFKDDWPGIGNAGLLRGAYHYAQPTWPMSTAVDQARYFVSKTGSMNGGGDLPPMLDLEDTDTNLTSGQIVEWSRIWLGEVERLTGRRPIIYTGRWYWSGYLGSNLGLNDYRLWLSDYNGQSAPTHTIAGWNWTIWQFTSTGSVPGIVGNVDVNRFCCSDANLHALAGPGPNAAAANPFGSVDTATKVNGEISVRGWAIDPDTTGPVKVHIYANGQIKGEWTANTSRADIGSAFPGWGSNHGFTAKFPATGDQNVCVYVLNTGAGNGNPQVGCRNVSGAPVGNIDRIAAIPGGVRVDGWAFDPDDGGPAEVHVYANNVGRAVTANGARSDVAGAFGITSGQAGFTVDVPASGSTNVCVYILNRPSGPAKQVGCRTFDVRSGNPVGSLDLVRAGPGGLRVAGWALDPDTAAPIPVHIYDNGAPISLDPASTPRADIGSAFPGHGPNHGYDITIPQPVNGRHEICAFAINQGPGTTHPPLGCKTVEVRGGPEAAIDAAKHVDGGASVHVAGWAFDPDAPTAPLQIRIGNSGGVIATITANQARPDVAGAYPGIGPAHGFDAVIPLPGGVPSPFWVEVVGVGGGIPVRTLAEVSAP